MIEAKNMSRRILASLLAVLVLSAGLSTPAAAQDTSEADSHTFSKQWTSAKGNFQVRYRSALRPITINQIHRWVLRVETSRGEPVSNALITMQGGMPEHDHGLPTSPRSRPAAEDGDYLLEGIRFHMPGYWELTVSIKAGSVSDTVLIPLRL